MTHQNQSTDRNSHLLSIGRKSKKYVFACLLHQFSHQFFSAALGPMHKTSTQITNMSASENRSIGNIWVLGPWDQRSLYRSWLMKPSFRPQMRTRLHNHFPAWRTPLKNTSKYPSPVIWIPTDLPDQEGKYHSVPPHGICSYQSGIQLPGHQRRLYPSGWWWWGCTKRPHIQAETGALQISSTEHVYAQCIYASHS